MDHGKILMGIIGREGPSVDYLGAVGVDDADALAGFKRCTGAGAGGYSLLVCLLSGHIARSWEGLAKW